MSSTITATGFTTEAFDAFLAARSEPAWLTDLRCQAWARFMGLNLPSRKEEEWMRTDIRLFRFEKFALPSEPASDATVPESQLVRGVKLAGSMTTINSHAVQAE